MTDRYIMKHVHLMPTEDEYTDNSYCYSQHISINL